MAITYPITNYTQFKAACDAATASDIIYLDNDVNGTPWTTLPAYTKQIRVVARNNSRIMNLAQPMFSSLTNSASSLTDLDVVISNSFTLTVQANSVGLIVDTCMGLTITNCKVSRGATSNYPRGEPININSATIYYVGGIVGSASHQDSKSPRTSIINCVNYVDFVMIGSIGYNSGGLGGIVGRVGNNTIQSFITLCQNHGYLDYTGSTTDTNNGFGVGGIAGLAMNTEVASCLNNGDVNAYNTVNSRTGGIVGAYTDAGSVALLRYNRNDGTVRGGTQYAGGFTGYMSRTNSSSKDPTKVTGNYNTAFISAGEYAGGIIGYLTNSSGSIYIEENNACLNEDIRGNTYVGGIIGAGSVSGSGYLYLQNNLVGGSFIGPRDPTTYPYALQGGRILGAKLGNSVSNISLSANYANGSLEMLVRNSSPNAAETINKGDNGGTVGGYVTQCPVVPPATTCSPNFGPTNIHGGNTTQIEEQLRCPMRGEPPTVERPSVTMPLCREDTSHCTDQYELFKGIQDNVGEMQLSIIRLTSLEYQKQAVAASVVTDSALLAAINTSANETIELLHNIDLDLADVFDCVNTRLNLGVCCDNPVKLLRKFLAAQTPRLNGMVNSERRLTLEIDKALNGDASGLLPINEMIKKRMRTYSGGVGCLHNMICQILANIENNMPSTMSYDITLNAVNAGSLSALSDIEFNYTTSSGVSQCGQPICVRCDAGVCVVKSDEVGRLYFNCHQAGTSIYLKVLAGQNLAQDTFVINIDNKGKLSGSDGVDTGQIWLRLP